MRSIDPDDVAFWWVVLTIVVWIILGVAIGIKYDAAVRCCGDARSAESRCADAVD